MPSRLQRSQLIVGDCLKIIPFLAAPRGDLLRLWRHATLATSISRTTCCKFSVSLTRAFTATVDSSQTVTLGEAVKIEIRAQARVCGRVSAVLARQEQPVPRQSLLAFQA
jgi:hypothetical protein